MEIFLQLNLQKLFPNFNSPLSSRFSKLFYELSKINLPQSENLPKTDQKKVKENQDLENFIINPEKILKGDETRTSIIIKQIPAAFGPLNFYELLSKFSDQIEFFYVPDFEIAKWKYIYAFVTVSNQKGVLDIYKGLTLLRDVFKTFKGYNFSKIEVYFCRSQNRTSLMKNCQKGIDQKNFFVCK